MQVITPFGSIDGVSVTNRNVIDQLTVTAPITTGVTLASLCAGAVIPANARAVEIQPDGGNIRIGLKTGTTVTTTTGYRLDDGVSKVLDSSLTSVTVVAAGTATLCSVTFYDRV